MRDRKLSGEEHARQEILHPSYRQNLIRNDRFASLGKLSAEVAHEIINPLSAILNFAFLMQHFFTDEGIPAERFEDFRKYVSQIADEALRTSRFVGGFLDYCRGGEKASPMGINLNRVVERTAFLLNRSCRAENVTIELDLQGDLPPIGIDVFQIQQVVMNLLINAIDATRVQGRGRITIRTFVRNGGGPEVLEVLDDGEGIRPEFLSKIFEPFFTTRERDRAVGLGLTIVQAILEDHGGTIEVESAVAEGTRARAILPLAGSTPP